MNNIAEVIIIILASIIAIPIIFLGLIGSAFLLILGLITRSSILWSFGFNIAYSIDQFGNALLLGDPDETISSRTGRALLSNQAKRFVYPLGWVIDGLALIFGDKNHVRKSVETNQQIKKELWSWIKP